MITSEDLKENRYLKSEVEYLDREIEKFKELSIKHMFPSERAECAAALTELIGTFQERRRMCILKLETLIKFMDSIEDELTREIFRLRYEDGLEWMQVWSILYDRGYYYESDAFRQKCCRYIERYNRNESKKEKGPPCAV